MKISEHITLNEATKSITALRLGIDNTPTEEHLKNMQHLAQMVFEPLRLALGGKPLPITSFYRSPELNKKIGGSATSQHCSGSAMDIDADGTHTTNMRVFEFIRLNLVFDHLIAEFRKTDANGKPDFEWVHVSLKRNGVNRMQVLEAYKVGKTTKYKNYKP